MDLMQSAKLLIGNAIIYISLVLLKQNGNCLTVLALTKILFFSFHLFIRSTPAPKGECPEVDGCELMPPLTKGLHRTLAA